MKFLGISWIQWNRDLCQVKLHAVPSKQKFFFFDKSVETFKFSIDRIIIERLVETRKGSLEKIVQRFRQKSFFFLTSRQN